MQLFVTNETSPLEAVILGIGTDRGEPREINPMIRKLIIQIAVNPINVIILIIHPTIIKINSI